ncbi:MAG: LacI family transcriptional regulator [Pseudonocardia sp.]|nr:LacI family transcriptional regulator [Pseudonocardia sp.]
MFRPRVTIRDVAERAGVAISTVSHAISGRRPVSEATRQRVLDAAAELGYGANPVARSLRTGRSGLIGLILRPRDAVHGSLGGTETFNRLSGAIATAALDHGIGLVHVPDILDPRVSRVPMDGCIVAHPYGGDEVLGELIRRDLPVVTVEEDPDRPEFAWSVRLDHRGAVTDLLDRLRVQGARRIMLLTGTEDNAWNRRAREAYLAWTKRHRMPPRHAALYEGEGADGAARLIAPVLAEPEPPDAIIAAASRFAAGIAQIADKLDLAVPDGLMLAALTDSEYTRANDPPISAIDLALEQLGIQAVELMLQRLAGAPPPAEPIVLQPTLHWRPSTTRA